MARLQIQLDARLTVAHKQALVAYWRAERRLTHEEKRRAFEGLDWLKQSVVQTKDEDLTFGTFYNRYVDGPYADGFIASLYTSDEVEVIVAQQHQTIEVELRRWMVEAGFYDPQVPETVYLLIYVLYWWRSFAHGYGFEVAILRDLERSGVPHQAHDPRQRSERYSSADLFVGPFRGDVRTTTYFLTAARTRRLPHDFYITALYDARRRTWRRAVLLKAAMWEAIDGETTPTSLPDWVRQMSEAGAFTWQDQELVVVDYTLWKETILAWNVRGEGR
jgi:hypothetical protein